jgi:sorting nexin-29
MTISYTEKITGNHQYGFRPNRSAVEQIFTLRMLLQKTNEYNLTTYHLFIDFKSAYDTVGSDQLYQAMKQLNILARLTRLVKMTMMETLRTERKYRMMSGEIKTKRGLQKGGTMYYKIIQLLGYADDIDIVARTPMALEVFLSLGRAAKRMALLVYEQKNKIYGLWPQPF